MAEAEAGFAEINGANIYYETMGEGRPFVMIHAGVADCRQWNNEFDRFASDYRVARYDLRGYGRSEPVDRPFTHMSDLEGLLENLGMAEGLILMGCSMGGGLAMDFVLDNPSRVNALIMVDSGPSGLQLDAARHPKAEAAEEAYNAGDLDLVAELETQIWFDGMGRAPEQVDREMRELAYRMNRHALAHDAKHLGERLPDSDSPAAERLEELSVPVLIVVGEHDVPYIQAASDYMESRILSAKKVVIEDAAHLPNMDQPDQFQRAVVEFLNGVQG